jgi:hypothetical protein
MEYHPITQIIISLIILLLMGYVAYNIYLIELRHMFKGNNDIRKETEIINGIYDFSLPEVKFNTINKSHMYYRDISPSINQQGGAEYSYNFWLYVDQNGLNNLKETDTADINKKDIILFYKGEKAIYYNKNNYNCQYKMQGGNNYINLITKNPLVRIKHDGTSLAIDYNNILSPDSYQNNSMYKKCEYRGSELEWNEKNKNMLGIYDITFNNKWFMVTIVIKEVADNNNILTKNRAVCRLYINGMLIFENKVETMYGTDIYSATMKNNKSPFYINPTIIEETTDKDYRAKNPYFNINTSKHNNGQGDVRDLGNILRMADLKYYNYAIDQDMINSIYRKGFYKDVITSVTTINKQKHYVLSQYELDNNKIKEL